MYIDKVTCPYCDGECEVDHDDGLNYKENETNEMQCEHCNKDFAITTSISFYHEGYKIN